MIILNILYNERPLVMKNVDPVSEIFGRSVIWCTVISSLLIDGRQNKYAFYLLRCYLILTINV